MECTPQTRCSEGFSTNVGKKGNGVGETHVLWDPSTSQATTTMQQISEFARSKYNDSPTFTGKLRLVKRDSVDIVIVLILHRNDVRKVMVEAVNQGMTNGEYIYFAVDVLQDTFPNGGWNVDGASDNDIAKKAYQSLFFLTLEKKNSIPAWQALEASIKKSMLAASPLFTATYSPNFNMPTADVYNLTYHGAAFYDCIMYQAMTYQEFYKSNPNAVGSIYYKMASTSQIQASATYLWGLGVYKGATGDMFIMFNGDRDENFGIYNMVDRNAGAYDQGLVAIYEGYVGLLQLTGTNIVWPRSNNTAPPSNPPCGFGACDVGINWGIIAPGALIPLILLVSVLYWYQRRRRLRDEALEDAWHARWSDLKITDRDRTKEAAQKKLLEMAGAKKSGEEVSGASMNGASMGASMGTSMGSMGMSMGDLKITATAFWKNVPVTYRASRKATLHKNTTVKRQTKQVLAMEHENLLPLIGACFEKEHVMLIYDFANKGFLRRIISNEAIKLDWTVRFSFLNDCSKGLSYIHGSPIKTHGRLTSFCCYIDAGFQLKIADYGMSAFFELNVAELWAARRDPEYRVAQLWKAPEHLVAEAKSTVAVIHPSSREGDIYSWAVIAQELMLRTEPFSMLLNRDPGYIIEQIKSSVENGTPQVKPILDSVKVCTDDLRKMVDQCYEIDPAKRPKMTDIRQTMRDQGKVLGMLDHSNVLDTLLLQMEEQSARLQAIVDEKGRDLLDEKRRCDTLLYKMLPKAIAETLKKGIRPSPESYELVTTAFFDILGFATMAQESTPLQVIDFLNDLYGFFDESIQKFDAYKIESNNDVTLVVSGLPVLNGILHAREIGRLALTILFKINSFKIKHRPDDQIKLRVGTHSGPLVAGVIGLVVPSFCLYGDTINICSRMMQTGESLKIQISSMTKNILETFGSFRMIERGEIFVKGKGAMKTYWLVGEDGNMELLELQRKFEEDIEEDEYEEPKGR